LTGPADGAGSCHGRRRVLGLAVGAAVGGLFPAGPAVADLVSEPRELRLVCINTGEALTAEYWNQGRYHADALAAIDHLLRDFRSGETVPISRRLINLAWAIQRWSGVPAPLQVVSGYRSAATNAQLREEGNGRVAVNSYHMKGMALDLRLPGVGLRSLHRAALRVRGGGVGLYPDSRFVHLDVGPVRRW